MRKIALVIDVASYPTAPLMGPPFDSIDVSTMLMSAGLKRSEIIQLADQRATADNIKIYTEQVVDLLKPDDFGLWYFSGHGAQVPTQNSVLEPDGLDEVLCGIDFDWSDEKLVRDKWLHETWNKIRPGTHFRAISDSCHSGDLTREIPGPTLHIFPKHFPIPHDIHWAQQAAHAHGFTAKKDLADLALNLAFISGCRSDQTSADGIFDGRHNGVMTYFLMKVLRSVQPGTSIIEIGAKLTAMISAAGYTQRPQLEGEQINEPFFPKFV